MINEFKGPNHEAEARRGGLMNLKEAAEEAVRTRNHVLAGKVADVLRFKFDMTYDQVYAWVNERAAISPPAWETLMEDADYEE